MNYGDNAINLVICKALSADDLAVVSKNFWSEEEAFGGKYYSYPKIIRWLLWNCSFLMDLFNYINIKNIINANNYDAIIIGGGELLGCNFGFNSSLYLWTKLSKKKDIPVYLIGVSGSLDMPKNKIRRNAKSLSICKRIYARDSYTKKMIEEKYGYKCEKIHDCVFSYKKIFKNLPKLENKDSILVAPILFYDGVKKGLNLKNEEEYLDYMKNELYKEVMSHKNNKIVITCTDLGDESFSNKFYQSLLEDERYKKNSIVFCPFTTLEDFLKLVNKSELIISSRMHAMILGKVFGADIHPIVFKNKLKIFKNEYQNIKNINNIELESYNQLKSICNTIMNDLKEK